MMVTDGGGYDDDCDDGYDDDGGYDDDCDDGYDGD